MSPERQKKKTLEGLIATFLAMASELPVLLVVEDLHWMDPSTLELLTLLLDQIPTARLFVLLTARPAFRPPWTAHSYLTVLTLSRFTREQTELMVDQVAGGKALPPEVLQQIVTKTDGVPLFVEELTKMVQESGLLTERADRYELRGPLPPLAIPATLHDSLMARLDRLASAKAVAQLGATLGRAFPYELLRAVSLLDDATLQQALVRLVEAELLYQRGVVPCHACSSMPWFKTRPISRCSGSRQQSHQRIAQVLEARFAETRDTQPELLAHHYTEAGLLTQAIPYWQRAGQRAFENSAHVEAINHLTKGLELVHLRIPVSVPSRLVLPRSAGVAGHQGAGQRGSGAPTSERARSVKKWEDSAAVFDPVGLSRFMSCGRSSRRHGKGEQLSTSPGASTTQRLMVAHWALGQTLLFLGSWRRRAHI
jgi:hypothetical protein